MMIAKQGTSSSILGAIAATVVLLLLVSVDTYSAEISVSDEYISVYDYPREGYAGYVGGKQTALTIKGEIDKQSVQKAMSLSDKLDIRYFILNSTGGDVAAALELGRYMRRKEIGAVIDKICASSCVLLYAAATRRSDYSCKTNTCSDNPSDIVIHRPFGVSSSPSMDTSAKDYDRINLTIRQYLKEMHIPESLLDLMNAVAPTSSRPLSNAEALFYFPPADPVWLDHCYSVKANDLGISKKDFIFRRQRVEPECKHAMDLEEEAVRRRGGDVFEIYETRKVYLQCEKDIMAGKR